MEVQNHALVFRGTRIRPSRVLMELARGTSMSQLVARWPGLTRASIGKALQQGAILIHPGRRKHTLAHESASVGRHLECNPRVCHGRLVFKGTRVPVETVLTILGQGESMAEVLEGWPQVTPAALRDALRRAARSLMSRPERVRESARPRRSP